MNEVLDRAGVQAVVVGNRAIDCGLPETPGGRAVLETQIHTVFATAIRDADLDAARVHYLKARRHLDAAEPDYENSVKESVSSIEALAVALTGERDLPTALRKTIRAGVLPRPLDELILKLYA